MKKVIFALLGATAMTLIPTGVNATTQKDYGNGECAIVIGKTETVNISSTNCRILNRGTLNINGATINKLSEFNGIEGDGIDKFGDAAILNDGGTINMNSGKVYADYGYGIINRGGIVNVKGGTIHSILHQAIHSNSGKVNISSGTLKGAIGGEEVIYANSGLTICGGNFNSKRSNLGAEAETQNCPKAAETETVKITVTASIKDNTPAKQQNTATSTKSTTTTKPVTTAKTNTTNPEPTTVAQATEEKKTEAKTDEKVVEKKDEEVKAEEAKNETSENNEDNNTLIFAVAAIVAVLGVASTAIVINRIRR